MTKQIISGIEEEISHDMQHSDFKLIRVIWPLPYMIIFYINATKLIHVKTI